MFDDLRKIVFQIMSNTYTSREKENCPYNATSNILGDILSCYCPPIQTSSVSIWGTETYTHDSKICRAAVHDGSITTSGGNVMLELTPGLNSYPSSTRNSVISSPWGAWSLSYVFQTQANGCKTTKTDINKIAKAIGEID